MSNLVITVAEHAGFCWGVKRALEMALEAARTAPGPVNTLGPLIHNPEVIRHLEKHGVGVLVDAEAAQTGTVVLRSHGVPRHTQESLASRGLTVVDATCPFVACAQNKAASLNENSYLVVILGEKEHPEVLSLRSYAGEGSLVAESPSDLPEILPSTRVGVVVQTTQSPQRLSELVSVLAPKTHELLVHNTICSATEERQSAAVRLAARADVVIVVGGRNSANTRRLTELCSLHQPCTYHVESAVEIDPAWIRGAQNVGVTAGASTPPEQIEAVVKRLREMDK